MSVKQQNWKEYHCDEEKNKIRSAINDAMLLH
jgi:hypothetical protein